MCGRYALKTDPKVLVNQLDVVQVALSDGVLAAPDAAKVPAAEVPIDALRASYNIAPTQQVPAVAQFDAALTLALFSWGLVPSWAKDPAIGTRMINARVETVAEKPSFRSALAKRRCLVPADGWFEWQHVSAGRKVPHYLTSADGQLLTFAGLYERWTAPDGYVLWSLTVITTQAQPELAAIHDRMPLVVPPDLRSTWLGADAVDVGDVVAQAQRPGQIHAWPVSADVGNVRNNRADLIEAV